MTNYPGTIIEAKNDGATFLKGLFIGGNIAMSQINAITGVGTPTLQNWVNRGFLSRPIGKKYSMKQVGRILIINTLRRTVKLDDLSKLLIFINGEADNVDDDIINEDTLYCMICNIVLSENFTIKKLDSIIDNELLTYNEQYQGAKMRLKNALGIICRAYVASNLLEQVDGSLKGIGNKNIFGKTL